MKTFGDIAQEMLDNLQTKERTNGAKFVCMKEDIDWQKDIIFEAHGDRMPDDDVYSRIEDILCHFSECETEDEAQDRICEIEPDCYTSDLTAWLHSRNDNVYYLEEAISMGCSDGFGLLACAQKAYIDEIACSLLSGIVGRLEDVNA